MLDSSAALGWIYPDEATDLTRAIFDRVAASGAWVPSLWRIEIANSLQVGIRRGRIDRAFRDRALGDLARLDVEVEVETGDFVWNGALPLADRFGLTVYDATYLELAQRRALPLASLDNNLRRAAAEAGVTLVA